MATATRAFEQRSTVFDRAVHNCRQAAQMSRGARALIGAAGDALEDGAHEARRAMKSVRRHIGELGDFRDEAIHRVKRHPGKAVGVAFGAGLAMGLAAGWIGRRCPAHTQSTSAPLEAVEPLTGPQSTHG